MRHLGDLTGRGGNTRPIERRNAARRAVDYLRGLNCARRRHARAEVAFTPDFSPVMSLLARSGPNTTGLGPIVHFQPEPPTRRRRGHCNGEATEARTMQITYRVRFVDERRPRSRVFELRKSARAWASRNRPNVDYVIAVRSKNALHAAIAYLLRRGYLRRCPSDCLALEVARCQGPAQQSTAIVASTWTARRPSAVLRRDRATSFDGVAPDLVLIGSGG